MKTSILLFASLVFLALTSSVLISCDKKSQTQISDIVTEITSTGDTTIIPQTPTDIYAIIDGSGSGHLQYAVPKIDIVNCEQLVDLMAANGGGNLYLNHIDKNGDNNLVSHVYVPNFPIKPTLRKQRIGEQSYQFKQIRNKYEADSLKYESALAEAKSLISILKNTYHNQWEKLLETAYAPKSHSEDYSDIIGVVNSAVRSLTNNSPKHHKYILALSDLEQSLPNNKTPKQLNTIPDNIKIIRVNNSDSGKSVVANTIETDNFDNAIKNIFNQ